MYLISLVTFVHEHKRTIESTSVYLLTLGALFADIEHTPIVSSRCVILVRECSKIIRCSYYHTFSAVYQVDMSLARALGMLVPVLLVVSYMAIRVFSVSRFNFLQLTLLTK